MNQGNNLLGNQGESKPLDKTLKQVYIDLLKNHIELLESKKEGMINAMENGVVAEYLIGVIKGLNIAIEQLNENISILIKEVK